MDSVGRFFKYFEQLVRKATATLPFAGTYPYTVESCDRAAQTISARSLTVDMPDLTDVPMAAPGLFLNLQPGDQVKIGFAGLLSSEPYVAGYTSTASVENLVHVGWLGLSQVAPPASTLTVVYVPWDTVPPPAPEAEPNVPTPLTPSPVFFKLFGKVTGGML